jgi:hypothetical protein
MVFGQIAGLCVKKIFIHIGPPKTGSSAIQNWLCNNADYLSRQGIYYPTHDSDVNKISSGNVLSIYDRQEDKSLEFNESKVTELLERFNNGDWHTLLLSSEYFYNNCEELSKIFQDAIFIAYIRSPLEFLESTYNQSVKRHGNTKEILLPKNLNGPVINRLEGFINTIGKDRFCLRCYLEEIFISNNIVRDFLSIFGVVDIPQVTNEKVNQSYSYEALELKRWLNNFDLKGLDVQLDRALQGYTSGINKFSLIKPRKFNELKRQNVILLNTFFSKFTIDGADHFLKSIGSVNQNEYFVQEATSQYLSEVTKFIFEEYNGLYFEICNRIKDRQHTGPGQDNYDFFCSMGNGNEQIVFRLIKKAQSYVTKCISFLRRFLY